MLNKDRSGLRLSGLFIGDFDSICSVRESAGLNGQAVATIPLPHFLSDIIHPLDQVIRLFFGEDYIHLIIGWVRVDLAHQVAWT